MKLKHKNNKLIIDFENTIFAKNFFEEFYEIQQTLDSTSLDIVLDISNGVWFDLMCLLNILLTLINNKDRYNTNIEIIIFNEQSTNEKEHIRLIDFLKSCGFFEVIKEYLCDKFDMNQINNILANYKDFLMKTEFHLNECVIPLLIINDRNYISNNSDYLRNKLQLSIGNDLSKYDFDMLYNKFIFFLQETIENAFEHAYTDSQKKYCSILVRKNNNYKFNDDTMITKRNYHGKFCKNDNSLNKLNYQKTVNEKSPYWNRSRNDKSAYLEIFVSDIGKGLLKSFGETDPHKDRNIIENIFSNGMRSNKKAKTSTAGGLFMIYNLLAESNDSVSIKSDINWSNFKCSDLVNVDEYCNYISSKGLANTKISHGFSIIGYIGINSFSDSIKQNFLSYTNKETGLKNKIKLLLEDNSTHLSLSRVTKMAKVIDNRIVNHQVNLDKNDFNNIDVLVLLPSKHMSIKDIQKLNISINSINKHGNIINNFIIADIPDNEVNKYYNIYDKNEVNIENLVLISQSIRIARFISNGKNLIYSKESTIDYINNLTSKGALNSSLKQFCSWIRKYDSNLIWNYIAEYQTETKRLVFINDEIDWNNLKLNKYLDFSQVMTISKCNKLCLYQIFRLFDYEEKIYFHSAERFTDQLCEQVNRLGNLSSKDTHVKVGSVFVTGTSANLSSINNDYIIYFFNHGQVDNKILSFFEWAQNDKWINNKFGTSATIKYKRIGTTPFVATNGNEFFMERHYDNIKDVFAIDTPAMYNLIQDNSALSSTSISQVGHFDINGEHDFLLVDVISIIKKAKIQSAKNPKVYNNAWDFIFCELYYSIFNHKKMTKKNIKKHINSELPYSENLVNKLYSYGQRFNEKIIKQENIQGGIIVYLNDFKSSYIIEEMKDMFSLEIRERFFSIPTLINGRESTSLLISPLLISTIENYIANLNQSNVTTTIFSAVTTSTRSRKEIKHIMYKLGSTNVKTLTVIDRQRFTLGVYNSQSHKAFMRLDLPQLGPKNSCMLCAGIKKINELKEIIISNLIIQRINNITTQWGVLKYSDDHYSVGIKLKKEVYNDNVIQQINNICNKCQIDQINIDSNVGLIMFIIENIVVSISTELLDDCLSDNDLDDKTKILILSSYLIHFNSNEITYNNRIRYCKKLYGLLSVQNECDNYTSLALIVLLSNSEYLLFANDIMNSKKNTKTSCIDDLIIQLFLYTKSNFIDGNKYNSYDCYLKQKSSITKMLYGINLYTNKLGNHNHSRSLIRLYDEGKSFDINEYTDALNAAEYLFTQYNYLPLTLYKDTQKFSNQIDNVINKLANLKLSIQDTIDNFDPSINWIPKNLSAATEDFFNEAEKINDFIFCKTDCDIVEKKLLEICKDAEFYLSRHNNKAIKIIIRPINDSHWFYFYNDIIEEIKYLIGDFRHSSDTLIDPYSVPKDSKEYLGLIKVTFNDKFVEFKFYNAVNDYINIDEIKKIKKNKIYRPTILDFELFDNLLGPDHNVLDYEIIESKNFFNKRTLCVTLSIPYVDIK